MTILEVLAVRVDYRRTHDVTNTVEEHEVRVHRPPVADRIAVRHRHRVDAVVRRVPVPADRVRPLQLDVDDLALPAVQGADRKITVRVRHQMLLHERRSLDPVSV